MRAKAFKRERGRWQRFYQLWKEPLGLGDWLIDIYYYDKPFTKARRKGRTTVAMIRCDWEYKKATLEVNCKALAGQSDRHVERCVIHELMHCKVNEMRHYSANDGIYHEERVVTELEQMIGWVRDFAAAGKLPHPERL